MDEDEANKVREANDLVRKEREDGADKIAAKFSVFKRDYLSSPIRAAMYAVSKGTTPPKPCQIPYRKEEKFWVFPEGKDLSVVFEVNFDSIVDVTLARIFLLELKDSKRAVLNSPGIDYRDKDIPKEVANAFPDGVSKFPSNGMITFKLGAPHLKKGIDEPLSQLIGFRQYLHFHLHAIKI